MEMTFDLLGKVEAAKLQTASAKAMTDGIAGLIELAAIFHGERVRMAIARVFDVEDTIKRFERITQSALKMMQELQQTRQFFDDLVCHVGRQIDELDKRIGAVEVLLEGK